MSTFRQQRSLMDADEIHPQQSHDNSYYSPRTHHLIRFKRNTNSSSESMQKRSIMRKLIQGIIMRNRTCKKCFLDNDELMDDHSCAPSATSTTALTNTRKSDMLLERSPSFQHARSLISLSSVRSTASKVRSSTRSKFFVKSKNTKKSPHSCTKNISTQRFFNRLFFRCKPSQNYLPTCSRVRFYIENIDSKDSDDTVTSTAPPTPDRGFFMCAVFDATTMLSQYLFCPQVEWCAGGGGVVDEEVYHMSEDEYEEYGLYDEEEEESDDGSFESDESCEEDKDKRNYQNKSRYYNI